MASSKNNYNGFDAVFAHIKHFGGRYQAMLYFGSCVLILPIAMQLYCLIFATGTPQFHCSDVNTTCLPNKCCDNCTNYSFDGPFTSVVSDWNLICDRAYLAAMIQSIFMAGMLVGSIVFGVVSDAFGRRKTIFLTALIMVGSGVGSALVDCLSFFAFLRFLVGVSLTGLMVTQFVFSVEILGPSKRAIGGMVQMVYWVSAGGIIVLMAYFIRNWSSLLISCTLPLLAICLFWRVFPESPRWLALKGETTKACAILLKFKSEDGGIPETETIMEALKCSGKDEIIDASRSKQHTLLDVLKSKRLRKRLLILAVIWMSVSVSYYGFIFYVTMLSGNLYLNSFLLFLIDLPQIPLGWFLLDGIGRRLTLAAFLLVGGGTCLFSLAVTDYPVAIIAITLIGKFCGSAAFMTAYIYTAELFPTVVRNIAVGTGSMSARVGGIIAPFIVMLSQLPNVSTTLPIVVIGVFTVVSGLLALCLPETLGFPMHQTIQEAEQAPESHALLCRYPWRNKDVSLAVYDSEHPDEPIMMNSTVSPA